MFQYKFLFEIRRLLSYLSISMQSCPTFCHLYMQALNLHPVVDLNFFLRWHISCSNFTLSLFNNIEHNEIPPTASSSASPVYWL